MASDAVDLVGHLEELRSRLIIAMLAWLVGFVVCYGFAESIFTFIAQPVLAALPAGNSLVFVYATEPFFTYLKLSAVSGFVVSLPIILWQVWVFVAPALYPGEKKLAVPFVLSSCICFAGGTYFGFTIVFPVIFKFLVNFASSAAGVQPMLSMGGYLTMSTHLLLAFGLVFELPIVIFFLVRLGVIDHYWLSRHRSYALLLAFVFGAILTPPDVFSQLAIALPFIALYEIGILVARIWGKTSNDNPED